MGLSFAALIAGNNPAITPTAALEMKARAIAFTVIWGLFILNLDRWLMSTVVDRDGWARLVRFASAA